MSNGPKAGGTDEKAGPIEDFIWTSQYSPNSLKNSMDLLSLWLPVQVRNGRAESIPLADGDANSAAGLC
jgi:hypothetical protein